MVLLKCSLCFCVMFFCLTIVSAKDDKNYQECDVLKRMFQPYLCTYIVDTQKWSYNPDDYLDTVQFARKYGYPSESHTVLTDDGYLLTLHRIPGTKSGKLGGQPVFLQHGLLASSFDYVADGNISIAFMLADLGYDVWLGNARGNTYSKAHISLSIDSPQYWNFSFHEMAIHDLPAALTHVTNVTNKPGEIIYIGHSMGTTMFFIMSSMLPEVAKNVKLMVALAPVAYMTHIKSPIRYLSPFVDDVEWLRKLLGINQFLPNDKLLRLLSYECDKYNFEKEICENIVFLLCGFDKDQFNDKILGVILEHTPAGSSTKTILHYAHEIKNGGIFQQYDYGTEGNKKQYGTRNPPSYNISNIDTKIFLMYGENDWLASPLDVKRLSKELKNLEGFYKIKLDTFNHVDFIFGKDVDKLVVKPMLQVMFNFTSNNVGD